MGGSSGTAKPARRIIQLEATTDELALCARGEAAPDQATRAPDGGNAVQMERLESRRLLAGEPLMITEFVASNGATLKDRFREYSDWVEIYNPTDQAVELGGWRLTDDAADLSKWQFPAASVAAVGDLVVFASGRNQVEVGKELHTNFQLASDGDYLGWREPMVRWPTPIRCSTRSSTPMFLRPGVR